MSLNDLRLAFGKKCSHVFHTVHTFKGPFLHSIFMRHMTIIASGIPGM